MSWLIRYPKHMVAAARHRKAVVFTTGYHTGHGPDGRSECSRTIDEHTASCLFAFAHSVICGRPPREAFESLKWPANEPSTPKLETAS